MEGKTHPAMCIMWLAEKARKDDRPFSTKKGALYPVKTERIPPERGCFPAYRIAAGERLDVFMIDLPIPLPGMEHQITAWLLRDGGTGWTGLVDPGLAVRIGPLADRDPTVTGQVRKLLAAAAEGALSKEELAHVRAGFFPGVAKAYQAALQAAGPLVTLELLEAHEAGDDREFRYRATFQGGAFELTLGLAPDGRVARFDLARHEPGP